MKDLKERVCLANKRLKESELIILTWGNVSEIDREKGLIGIKPSGVSYDDLTPDDIVIVDLDGNVVEGSLKPSSDTPTHIEIYKNFKEVGAVVHTHSKWATIWAQAGKDIPAYGTTHGDYFYGDIPCTRDMLDEEIRGEYERETGVVIVETFENRNINPMDMPGVLVKSHGPFTWGKNPMNAVENAMVLEELAEMATMTQIVNPGVTNMSSTLLDKHFLRKHGKNAYYGQDK